MKIKTLLQSAGILACLGLAAPASAALIEYQCLDTTDPAVASGGFTASSSISADAGATIDTTNCGPWAGNDETDLTATEGGYGFADWVELDKADGGNGSVITGTGWGTTSGTFSFSDFGYDLYLIALKFDGVYSTFTSDTFATDWEWNTDVDGNNKFAISHLTVYGRNGGGNECRVDCGGGGNEVPAPTTPLLLGAGLLALAQVRRRKA